MPSQPDVHYRLGPSSTSRWMACPWSLRAPPSTPGDAAVEGTIAHEYGANVLDGRCTLLMVPKQYQVGLGKYVDFVWSHRMDYTVERTWESMEIPAEATSRLPPCDLKEGFGGTLDCLLLSDDSAIVVDLKWGQHKVKAPDNKQLLSYASLVHEHFAVSNFGGAIVQPNAKGGPHISKTEFSLQEVIEHREQVKQAAASDVKRTGFQCLFCTLRHTKQCQEGVDHAKKKGWKYKV